MSRSLHITAYLMTTDAGPDEMAAVRRIEQLCSADPEVWVLKQACMMHQIHLSVLKLISKLDSYWSDLAKFVNSWRAPHRSSRLSDAWKEIVGLENANWVFRHLPPRPLRGRWGKVTNCEHFFLEAGWTSAAKVFQQVPFEAYSGEEVLNAISM
jgi:hypothetical protein